MDDREPEGFCPTGAGGGIDITTGRTQRLTPDQQADAVIAALNEAYHSDPAAIRTMVALIVPCNKELRDHPTVEVDRDRALLGEHYVIGPFGFLLGALRAAGIPTIAHVWSSPDENGERKLLGFSRYTAPEPPHGGPLGENRNGEVV